MMGKWKMMLAGGGLALMIPLVLSVFWVSAQNVSSIAKPKANTAGIMDVPDELPEIGVADVVVLARKLST